MHSLTGKIQFGADLKIQVSKILLFLNKKAVHDASVENAAHPFLRDDFVELPSLFDKSWEAQVKPYMRS